MCKASEFDVDKPIVAFSISHEMVSTQEVMSSFLGAVERLAANVRDQKEHSTDGVLSRDRQCTICVEHLQIQAAECRRRRLGERFV